MDIEIQTGSQQHSERKMHSVQKRTVQWYNELMMEVHYAEFLSESWCHIPESHRSPTTICVRNDLLYVQLEIHQKPKLLI